MIVLALALQAAAATPPTLGAIGRQQLPERGCAAYLWTLAGEGGDGARLVAMASADVARLRLALDGAAPVDLPRVAQSGEGALGLAAATDYRAGDVAATLALTVVPRPDLSDGATVPQATLTLQRTGRDTLVVPLAGLIGCAAATPAR